jgi:murein DD-endopeptidase MepM/ murein hydrolase activator NlpD
MTRLSRLFFILSIFLLTGSFIFAEQNEKNSLQEIQKKLLEETQKYYKSQEIIQTIEAKIRPLINKKATLKNQLDFFEKQLTLSSSKIENVEIQINQKRLKIAKLEELLERANIEIEENKLLVSDYIKNLYLEEKLYFNNKTQNPELIKLLLSSKSMASSLQEIQFIKTMGLLGEEIWQRLEEANNVFINKKNTLEKTKTSLNTLKIILEKEKYSLVLQKQGRENLLEETEGKESNYQKLLLRSQKEEESSKSAIQTLLQDKDIIEKNLFNIQDANFQEKQLQQKNLLELPDSYNPDDIPSDSLLGSTFMWPINPKKGISSYFLDSNYEKYFGKKHNAIDIPSPQGTSIYAPASAYVQEIQDNGLGYSYILLAHKNGLSTLYGHVSDILVEKGQLLQLGTIIGKTGGIPGTKGSGAMTTGAHLHFEVHQNGKAKNPLEYLSTELLP